MNYLNIFKDYFKFNHDMDINQALQFLLNLDYYKRNPDFHDKGLTNPIIIGNYVFRVWGIRSYSIYVRPKTDCDTPESIAEEADVSSTSFSMSQLAEYESIYHFSPDGW
jgi:hypothetical protein